MINESFSVCDFFEIFHVPNGFCWHEEISSEINFEHFHLNLNENSVSLENMKKYEANNAYKYETP